MRHSKRFNHLGRKKEHRDALLANLASQLIIHKRIKTTLAKAKALRQYVEPLITKGKTDTTHSRRVVFGYLKHKDPVKELFINVAQKVADRPGGYTRIIKLGNRLGDNAELAFIELVDFNENLLGEKKAKKSRRKRTRRGGSTSGATQEVKTEDVKTVSKEQKEQKTENKKTSVPEETAEKIEPEVAKPDEGVKEEGADTEEATEKKIEAKDDKPEASSKENKQDESNEGDSSNKDEKS